MATMLISLIRIFKLGPDVSLNGSPTVSPTTVRLVDFTAFAAKVAFFHILFGIIPCTTGICHEDGKHETTAQSANQQAEHTGNTENKSRRNRSNDSYQ